jgi:hypothetical protein
VIADVVSYAIAGISFIHAVGRSFVRKGQHEHCYDARLPQSSAPLAKLENGVWRQRLASDVQRRKADK